MNSPLSYLQTNLTSLNSIENSHKIHKFFYYWENQSKKPFNKNHTYTFNRVYFVEVDSIHPFKHKVSSFPNQNSPLAHFLFGNSWARILSCQNSWSNSYRLIIEAKILCERISDFPHSRCFFSFENWSLTFEKHQENSFNSQKVFIKQNLYLLYLVSRNTLNVFFDILVNHRSVFILRMLTKGLDLHNNAYIWRKEEKVIEYNLTRTVFIMIK